MRGQNPGAAGFKASLLAALNPMLAAEFIPKLTYFDSRGSGEVIRLILEETGTFYNERRISSEEWPAFKTNFTISQLPVLEEGDIFLNNPNEICRYLARKLDLLGNSSEEYLRCDIAHEILVAAQTRLFEFYLDPGFFDKRAEFEAGELLNTLSQLEAFLASNESASGYWVGNNLTYIDILAWSYLDSVRPLKTVALERFKLLSQFKQSIQSRPNIDSYLHSNRRPATLMLPLSVFGGTPETS
ncbi:MAG: glutathione S-transferase family protein [Pseudohongiellaceae bacterium]